MSVRSASSLGRYIRGADQLRHDRRQRDRNVRAGDDISATASADTVIGPNNFTEHSVQVDTNDRVHAVFTSSVSDKTTFTFANTHSTGSTATTTFGAGAASLTNAAKATITGAVTVRMRAPHHSTTRARCKARSM